MLPYHWRSIAYELLNYLRRSGTRKSKLYFFKDKRERINPITA
jgi:hypothetical protein